MKYNDNGTYKDIYVKSFDTLPVGTEVDYDGETVPTGWTEIDELIQKEELTLTYSTSGSNIIIDYSIDDLDNGIILINGHLEGGDDVYLTALINYGTRYVANIINIRGTNINNPQASLTNNNKALSVPATGTIPTGIGTVKAVLIKLG